jgi:hypothetical protein
MFTMIQDEAGDHHHPHVHYIFSDDNKDVVTGAVVETLSTQSVKNNSTRAGVEKEHYIILDLDSTSHHVVAAQSLSADWQVSSTDLIEAPSFADEQTSTKTRRMLKIRGFSAPGSVSVASQDPAAVLFEARRAGKRSHYDAMSTLAERFQDEFAKLQTLMSQWEAS